LSRPLTNELEERRVVRLLTGAAEAIEPLPAIEVETMVRRARTRSVGRRRASGSRLQVFSVAAVAAAVALAVSLPTRGQPTGQPAGGAPGSAAGLVGFPEGSALQLLLSGPGTEHA
jgi:hypothetical protein